MNRSIWEEALDIFYEISKIPRPSNVIKEGIILENHEWKVLTFLQNWATQRSFQYKTDTLGNICIYVPWTFGREDELPIILQGHKDIVCVKTPESTHDFETQWIDVYEQDGWLKAKNTTLGADNTIGLWLALAASNLASHPPIEILVTATEEVWLVGASYLESSILSGKATCMINLDTEDLWEIIIGCAGGWRAEIHGTVELEEVVGEPYRLSIVWWRWGHSWMEINKNRANILYESIEFLQSLSGAYRLVSLSGGQRDNAIPSDFSVDLLLQTSEVFMQKIEWFLELLRKKYDEPNLSFSFRKVDQTQKAASVSAQDQLFKTILSIKTGVYAMSEQLPDFVETSANLWVIQIKDGKVVIKYAVRSSVNWKIKDIISKVTDSFEWLGFAVEIWGLYPWWQQEIGSPFVQKVQQLYDEVYWKKSTLLSIHAWLECGILSQKLWGNIQIVSFGPNIYGAHSPEERCEIVSVHIIGEILQRILSEKL